MTGGLLWKVNRLRAMGPREVFFRMGRAGNLWLEARRVARGWAPEVSEVGPRAWLFGQEAGLLDAWHRHFRLDKPSLTHLLSGRIDFFGHAPLDVGNPVQWHKDPLTGRVAPLQFGKRLNYRDESRVGNVKFLWELGRHQHLVPLAVAYAVTGEAAYREAVAGQIEDWIRDNPFAQGIHWCSALEVALRLISWALVHSLLGLRDSMGLFDAIADPEQLGASIFRQAWFVRYYLSRHSSANNHLIGELCGLWTATTVFDLGAKGGRWRALAREELEREARLQVFEDGVDKEQACYYHLWVLEYLLFAWLVGQRGQEPLSDVLLDRVKAMARFLRDVAPDGGSPPDIGDSDDGFVARFEPRWPATPYGDVLDAVDRVFGRENNALSQKGFWYGAIAQAPSAKGVSWQRRYPVQYPQGGYAVLGGAGWHLVFDAGDLGYLGIAAHGHADALSVCLALDGQWWLVDPGTYAYHGEPEWRNYFRGTTAHNTVTVDGRDQSEIGGPFLWLRKARARLQKVEQLDAIQSCSGCHDGYQPLGVTHCRTLRLDPEAGWLEVIDQLEGRRKARVAVHYHFAPDVVVEGAGGEWTISRPGSGRRLRLVLDDRGHWAAVRGRESPILGWYSPALGAKQATTTLEGTFELVLPLVIKTRFRLL